MSKFDQIWKPLDDLILSNDQHFNGDLDEMWKSLEGYLVARKLIDKYDIIGVLPYN